jgi:hypothetical protein
MNVRQSVDRDRVLANDSNFAIAIVEQLPSQHARLDLKIFTTERALDGDFPDAADAELQVAVLSVNQRTGVVRQVGGVARRPQPQMCVEQQLQAPPPNTALFQLDPCGRNHPAQRSARP